MAEGILLRSGEQDLADLTMGSADRLLDSPSDIASQSEHDDDEDWKECDPDYVEDRFRVDRRKLELMIQATVDGNADYAEDFFLKVMEDTNTQISWPSKLKIGAKSKKDPHIKVAGKYDAVADAKNKIMAVLDTKSTRVTLKMDVSHTEHSHVIGKGGNNIKQVMQETGCHIHFPDSNRNNQLEKSNQVSIAGQPAGVEEARARIRELLPIVFMFELPVTGALQPIPDTTSPIIQQIQQAYSVTVTFKQRPRVYVTTVIVRGSVSNAKAMKEATAVLMKHLTGNQAVVIPVSIQLEIAPQHHLFMIGRGGANIKQIMQRTGATIHFPDPSTVQPQRKSTVYITGPIESVYLARRQLIGCLPLVLMFDLKEDIEIDQASLSQLMEQLDVFISIKPKPKQPSKSVIVKSIERNAANLHEARRRLLGATHESPVITGSLQDTSINGNAGLTTLDLLGQNLLNVNTSALFLLNGATTSRTTNGTTLSPHSPNSSPSTPFLPNPPASCLYSPMMVMAPPTGYPMRSPYMTTAAATAAKIYAQNQVNKDFSHLGTPQTSASMERAILGSNCSNDSSHSSPVTTSSTSPFDLISTTGGACVTCTIGSTPDLHSQQTTNSFVQDVVLQRHLSPCGSMPDLFGSSNSSPLGTATGSPLGTNPGSPIVKRQTVFMEDAARTMPFQNGESCRSSESSCESDGSEHRAPGCNRPAPVDVNGSSLFTGPLFSAFDYEQKKLLANKAMLKKPDGESSRIPTDFWSGLGFSKSMPDAAIRERLKHCYNGPSMTTTYENGEIDQDPWKDSKQTSTGYTDEPPISAAPGGYPSPRRKLGDFGLGGCCNHLDGTTIHKQLDGPMKTDLAELFSKLGLGKYSGLFQQQEIDLPTFLTLTDQDLKELGISTFGARRKMLLAIADLSKRQTRLSPAPGSNNPFRESRDNASSIVGSHRLDIASHSGRW